MESPPPCGDTHRRQTIASTATSMRYTDRHEVPATRNGVDGSLMFIGRFSLHPGRPKAKHQYWCVPCQRSLSISNRRKHEATLTHQENDSEYQLAAQNAKVEPVCKRKGQTAGVPLEWLKPFHDWLTSDLSVCCGSTAQQRVVQLSLFLKFCQFEFNTALPLADALEPFVTCTQKLTEFTTWLRDVQLLSPTCRRNYCYAIKDALRYVVLNHSNKDSEWYMNFNKRVGNMSDSLQVAAKNLAKAQKRSAGMRLSVEHLQETNQWMPYSTFVSRVHKVYDNVCIPLLQKLQSGTPATTPEREQLLQFVVACTFADQQPCRPMELHTMTVSQYRTFRKDPSENVFLTPSFKTASLYRYKGIYFTDRLKLLYDTWLNYIRLPEDAQGSDALLVNQGGSPIRVSTIVGRFASKYLDGTHLTATRLRSMFASQDMTVEEFEQVARQDTHSLATARLYYDRRNSRAVAEKTHQMRAAILERNREDVELESDLSELEDNKLEGDLETNPSMSTVSASFTDDSSIASENMSMQWNDSRASHSVKRNVPQRNIFAKRRRVMWTDAELRQLVQFAEQQKSLGRNVKHFDWDEVLQAAEIAGSFHATHLDKKKLKDALRCVMNGSHASRGFEFSDKA